MQLAIVRAARTLVKGPVANRVCGTLCWPQLPGALRVLDVEADGAPDVILNLYSGGAHCCFHHPDLPLRRAAGSYRMLLAGLRRPGYSLARLDGSALRWLSADDRFAYTFAAFAFSGLPLEILRFDGGRVRRRHRGATRCSIAEDAARQWGAFQGNRSARLRASDFSRRGPPTSTCSVAAALVTATLATLNCAPASCAA